MHFFDARRSVFAAVAGLLLISNNAGAGDQHWFPLRNHNPFLQVYGLPTFQSAFLAPDGKTQYWATFDIANHAESDSLQSETAIIDGESYYLTLSARHRFSKWLEIGFDLPVVRHSNGIFDNAIERWHKIWGLSNTGRNGDSNQLQFSYAREGSIPYELTSSASGIGDLQITAAVPLWNSDAFDGGALALRSSLKLPTGDEDKLLGSGATDVSFGLYASDTSVLGHRDLGITAFAGLLLLGKGEILPQIQERTVGFGGMAAAWRASERFSIVAQIYGQGNYLQSDTDAVGGNSTQLTVGGTYDFPRQDMTLSFAIAEDVFTDATADVALHLSIRWHGGNPEAASP